MLCQILKLGLSVIRVQAGTQFPGLDPRLRGDDARLRGDDARLRGDDGLTKHWLLSGLQ